MRVLYLLLSATFIVCFFFSSSCVDAGVAFDHSGQKSLFGVTWKTRGGGKAEPASNDEHHDPKKATSTILKSMAKVEETVQKAVEDEIHTLFHDLDEDHKAEIKSKASAAIAEGTKKVKAKVDSHDHPHHYPFYDYDRHHASASTKKKSKKPLPEVDHKDQRILQAVESAEMALLHTYENELGVFLATHYDAHHGKNDKSAGDKTTKHKTKKAINKGLEKATQHVDKLHQHRRDWMTGQYVDIQDYMEHDLD